VFKQLERFLHKVNVITHGVVPENMECFTGTEIKGILNPNFRLKVLSVMLCFFLVLVHARDGHRFGFKKPDLSFFGYGLVLGFKLFLSGVESDMDLKLNFLVLNH